MYVQNSDQTGVKAEYWELCRLSQNISTLRMQEEAAADAVATGRARRTAEAALIGRPATRRHESFLEEKLFILKIIYLYWTGLRLADIHLPIPPWC